MAASLLSCGASAPTGAIDEYASGQLGLVRNVTWPGGGEELSVKLVGATGSEEAEFRFTLDGEAVPAAAVRVTSAALEPGFTALLVVPAGSPEQRVRQAEALMAFVDERPASEAIGVFLWRESVEQLANFTASRSRLHAQLGLLPSLPPAAAPLASEAALAEAEERVANVGGRSPRGMRALVVAGSEENSLPPLRSSAFLGLAGASDAIDDAASSSYYQVNVCGGRAGQDLAISVEGFVGQLHSAVPKTLPESAGAVCDVAMMGAGQRSYPEVLDFVFSAAERSTYNSRTTALSTADFALSVTLDGSPAIDATAHLRGKGTLGCERKSYTLELAGAGRHLLPGSRTDEFYLLSMCADDRYVEQHTANQLLSELGLFPLRYRYVEVRLDGETQGVYLLLEKAREELVRDGARVHSVMRRRFETNPPADFFESKFSSGVFDAAAMYATAATAAVGASESIDIDQYLRFLAVMTAFGNGDYIDEIWVRATEQRADADRASLWFETMAWDNDDLFSECHYSGQFAFVDPNDLVYCAEAALDATLLEDPVVYARYVDILEELLVARIPPKRFDEAAEATGAAIAPFLARAGVSAAMVRLVADNPGAAEPSEALRDVAAKLEVLREQYRDRHALLLDRIAIVRGETL